jgi:hypothetical protein
MPPDEQRERMRSMRRLVAEFNVYRWAGRMLVDAAELRRRERMSGQRARPAAPGGRAVRALLARGREAVLAAARVANLLLAFDFDGTLAPSSPTATGRDARRAPLRLFERVCAALPRPR